jgi:hypothetical protein
MMLMILDLHAAEEASWAMDAQLMADDCSCCAIRFCRYMYVCVYVSLLIHRVVYNLVVVVAFMMFARFTGSSEHCSMCVMF